MKQFIAHRGNTEGKQPDNENTIEYLLHAYELCGGIECDIRTHDGKLYYGHDEPLELVDTNLINQYQWYCHAKDLETLSTLMQMGAHVFWHQQDTITITSKGYIWCYPHIHHPDPMRAIWTDFEDEFTSMDQVGGYGLCGDKLIK
jgi:glycerophosphoryl diester phosphodiesterase|tara:strand:+ start:288 stop:722 length:435 start_codon:yes stop_codon:yes gene_type:complete